LVPKIAIDRGAAGGGAARKIFGAVVIARPFAAVADGALQPKQQAVEVDRNDFGRVDRDERSRIGEPARTEIPAALRGAANLAVG
jgi:hypothetical protein